MSGAAWWWMTRWTQPANLEAMFGAVVKTEAEAIPELTALSEPVVEAAETVVEAAAEPVVETLAETEAVMETVVEPFVEPAAEPTLEPAIETVLEALAEGPDGLEPVGGEAAPISPVLEAMAPEAIETVEPAPKLKKKPAAPKAD
jgi:hypothetical protein